jgi:tRNA-2-methylthio-N6-dimethylallyladenosine synthase
LLGQNVNAYHGLTLDNQEMSLATLIHQLAKINGLERIRYTTSHPCDMTDELIAIHRDVEKLMPFLHLPVQSGSDKVLQEMNRKHTANYYLKIIEKLKNAKADIAFSSDFIVGYPGETDKDFEDTIKLIKEVKFAQAYSFKYSPRPGTPASVMPQLPEDIKTERLAVLQNLLRKQQDEFNQSFKDKVIYVLVDKQGRKEGQMIGKSQYQQAVTIENAENSLGMIVPVKVNKIMSNSLLGHII